MLNGTLFTGTMSTGTMLTRTVASEAQSISLERRPSRRWLALKIALRAAVAAVSCFGLTLDAAAKPPNRQPPPAPPAIATPAPLPVSPSVEPPAAANSPAPAPSPSATSPPTALRTSAPGSAPQPPDDPRLAQVFAVFDANCSQCHQAGKLTGPAPGGSFANILDLDRVSREPYLVRRSEPDASPLYQMLVDRHRPLDMADAKWPTPDDIQRVRTWIEELPPTPQACDQRPLVTPDDIRSAIESTVRAAGDVAAAELRFVSLAHLANVCATASELDGYRQALAKLLNSLSWGAQPVALTAIDPAKSVFAFKLADIGWVAEHWDALSRAEPKAIALDLSGQRLPPGANARPIRGDWLAYVASQAPFYAELLGLPPTLDDLTRLLGIAKEGEPGANRSMRAGIRSSLLTRGPRVIERFQADSRRLWIVNDFLDGSGERDIFERPLGAIKGAPERAQYRADGRRAIFTLPNGFLGYTVLEPDGRRIDAVTPRLEINAAQSPGPSVAGLSCISCHAGGFKPFIDAVRAHVASDRFTGAKEVRDAALAAYDTGNDWLRVLDDDSYSFRRAQFQAGIDPDLTIHGLEPVAALARRYSLAVDLPTAAAEAALMASDFEAKLSGLAVPERSLVPRLRQGRLSRIEANRILAALKPSSPSAGDGPAAAPSGQPALRLALWTDKPTYASGDLMTVYVQPSLPCRLTLVSVAATGKATVLFPNEFDAENLVTPTRVLAVPDDKAPYQFRLKTIGAETLVASCQSSAKFQAGTEPDYERQRFTVLGNYENYLRTYLTLDAEALRKARAAKPSAPVKDAKLDAKDERSARAAVRITVR